MCKLYTRIGITWALYAASLNEMSVFIVTGYLHGDLASVAIVIVPFVCIDFSVGQKSQYGSRVHGTSHANVCDEHPTDV